MMTTFNIGEKIRHFRTQKGYSQEVMADLLDISLTAYGKIENNKTNISLKRLQQIAQKLEVNELELLSYGEKNVYYIHNHRGNATSSGSIINNTLPKDYQDLIIRTSVLEKEVEKLNLENTYLKEIIDLIKNGKAVANNS
jgi:transcriptional regulator with XRE-family HTH domain